MKRMILAVLTAVLCGTICFAQSNKKEDVPFKVSVKNLSVYLKLDPLQIEDVYEATEHFMQKQHYSMLARAERKEKIMINAIYENLKMMKSILTVEQYRKYVTLINVANNNNQVVRTDRIEEYFLAEK